jgi:Cysteine-rich CPCC
MVVGYGGERHGWYCYIDTSRPTSAETPAGAIAQHLNYAPGDVPAWAQVFSARRERELKDAPRYECPCCGYLTLLNRRVWEICDVCGWEDDGFVEGRPAAHSGPNHMSLNEARANFARDGASAQRRRERVRDPRPSEVPDRRDSTA